MSQKKYTITLTFDELFHVKEAINNRNMHYYEDHVEYFLDDPAELIKEQKEEQILKKLNIRIKKKWDKI
tara:strand:+ start:2079 stop:2285 length:207 start_codon:yes stop_codon:yes gene_type:complete